MTRSIVALLAIGWVFVADAKPIHSNGEAVGVAKSAIVQFKLTSNKPDCLLIEQEETTQKYFLLSVKEKHNEVCGGDPQTDPRLFDLRIYRKTGKVTSDVYSADGEFTTVNHPPNAGDLK